MHFTKVTTIIPSIFQMGKLRQRKIKCHAQGHIVSQWQSPNRTQILWLAALHINHNISLSWFGRGEGGGLMNVNWEVVPSRWYGMKEHWVRSGRKEPPERSMNIERGAGREEDRILGGDGRNKQPLSMCLRWKEKQRLLLQLPTWHHQVGISWSER